MQIYKDERISAAIKEAIGVFGKKNSFNGMDYLAEQLGFNGQNRAVQLNNHITHTNIEKDLKLTMFFAIMDQMDQDEQKIVLDAFANKYGFYVKEKEEGEKQALVALETIVTVGTLELGGTLGVINDDVVQAIMDGKINRDEAKRILKGLKEIHAKTRGVEDALIEFLSK